MRAAALLPLILLLEACDDAVSDAPGGSESEAVDLGTIDVTTPRGGVFEGQTSFDVPADTVGASLVVELPGGSPELVTVASLARGDTALVPLRVDPVESLCTAPYPASPDVALGPGRHTITVHAGASFTGVRLTGIFKRGGSTSEGALDVDVHLAGLDVDASGAEGDERLAAMLGELARLLAKAGVELGAVGFHDAPATFAEVEGPSSAPGTDLGRLFASSEATPGRTLHLFVVRRLSQEGGMPLYGVAGAVPGPGELAGTVHSGVVLNGEELAGSLDDRNAGPLLLGQVAAHEALHYLGLHHTTERTFDGGREPDHDLIRDTPECAAARDANGNGALSSKECSGEDAANLMFWAGVDYAALPAGTDAAVTAGQSFVVLRNPLVR
jgi:hypothetical protein